MHDDTLINPDDIGSAEELRDLLLRLGFTEVSILERGEIHQRASITSATRFPSVFLCNERIMMRVLTDNRFWFDVDWPSRDGWGFSDAGELTGPIAAPALTNHITTMAETRIRRIAEEFGG